MPIPFRVGVIVADAYQRGTNDFAVPGYDYTFKTYMAQSSDEANLFGEGSTTASPNADVSAQSRQSSTAASSNLFIGIGLATVSLVALTVFVIAYRRRNVRKVKSWYSASEVAEELRKRFGPETAPARQIFTHRSAFLEADEAAALEYDNHPSQVALTGMSKRTAAVLATVPGKAEPQVSMEESDDSTMFTKNVRIARASVSSTHKRSPSERSKELYDALRTPANIVATHEAPAIHVASSQSLSEAYITVTATESTLDDADIASGYMELFPEDQSAPVSGAVLRF